MAYSAHPEALSADWPDSAYLIREGALYVDLRDDGWHTPADFSAAQYQALRLKAEHYLQIVATGFGQHKWEYAQRRGASPSS